MYFFEKLLALLQSRRFWASIAAALLEVTLPELGFETTTVHAITATVIAWIIGDSIARTTTPRLEKIRGGK